MKRKVAFIGHREIICDDLEERLNNAIQNEINLGCRNFVMGVHGDFDDLSMNCCKKLKETYKNIEIEVVTTSLAKINPVVIEDECGKLLYNKYEGVKTIMYDIENTHFKQRISESNKQMINSCDTLICYVNSKKCHSGAKTALNFAKRKGLKIINLYKENDNPFYGMTEEQKKELWNETFNKKIKNHEKS